MDIDQLIHIWAQGNALKDKTLGNVSFRGPSLLSYAKTIGYIVSNNLVILREGFYSSTTSKHCGAARRATSHYNQLFIDVDFNSYDLNTESYRIKILDSALGILDRDLKSLVKKRSDIQYTIEKCQKQAYAIHYFLEHYGIIETPLKEDQKHLDPLLQWNNVKDLVCFKLALDQVIPDLKDKQAKIAAQEKAKKAKKIKEAKDLLIKWRLFEFNGNITDLDPALRFNVTNQEIETSHGAKVPLKDALDLYPLLVSNPESLRSKQLGNFYISRITEKTIVIGCHEIPLAEVNNLLTNLKD